MKQQRTSHVETSFANAIESFHLVFAVAPIFALIITTLLGKDLHFIIELILVGIVIVVNFFILSRKKVTEEGEELSPLYTFWTNKVLPNQSGNQQRYNVTVAIIEDAGRSYFRDNVQNKFKTKLNLEQLKSLLSKESKLKNPILKEPNLEKLVLEEVKDRHLFFQPIDVARPTKDNVEQLQKDFRQRLNDDLEKPTAVIVVRTSELDEKSWVYKAVISWADQHSEVPILFAKNPDKDFPENELANKFLWIPDDPKSLPWRLLQRAKNRAKVWRLQATYNRALVWNIFYLLLLVIYIGAVWFNAKRIEFSSKIAAKDTIISNQNKDNEGALATQQSKYIKTMDGMDEVIETEKAYRTYTSKKGDPKFSVSYWYGFMGKPYVFVTTEASHNHTYLESDTIIGCGFSAPNHIIERILKTNKVTAYDYDGNVVPLPEKCQYKPLSMTPINSITCVTYNDKYNDKNDPVITNRTVGICVFTEDKDNKIFSKNDKEERDFLIKTIRRFHKEYINSLENNNVISLDEAERQRKTLPAH